MVMMFRMANNYKIQPVFKIIRNESVTEVLQKLGEDCDAVAGDISITSNRTNIADFTIPYMSSEIYMFVPAARKWNQTRVTLLRPFTIKLWIAIIIACIFIGVAVGYLEYRGRNPDFLDVPFYQKLFMIIWFPVSKFFFQEVSYRPVDKPMKLPLSSLDDCKKVLDNRTVDAIFDELPYIEIFLAKYGDNYMKVGPLASKSGLGFVFPLESQLQPKFSRAIIKVTETTYMTDMKKIYLPNQSPLPTQPGDSFPESLDIHSFYLLFIFMGVATIITIICSEISLMRTQAQISPEILRNMMSTVEIICANSKHITENEH
ncbi:glutamate receptor 2.1-like [Helianthus annuus]|uniref:glutamate receptor 2.1-like n=1 Tax=Helianthus annuus TaxID=4232 RepID=UPI000B8F6547|nr:glutamate receptor 2.1-like [Helianthus annuus]